MKIRKLSETPGAGPLPHGPDALGAPHEKAVVFRRALTDLSAQAHTAELTALIGEIDKQGQRLAKKSDIRELERYRMLIRKFLEDVVSHGFAFTKENAFEGRGRSRLFAMVSVVNEKLEALAREVLSGQAENINILAMVGDIRGLLADMLL